MHSENDIEIIEREEENKRLLEKYVGKQIALVELTDSLKIYFDDGGSYLLIDAFGAGDCCNDRFMRTDDELDYYSDSIFYRLEERAIEDYDVQIDDNNKNYCGEKKFIVIHTSKGEFVISIHNESNGCYTGIDLHVSEESYQ